LLNRESFTITRETSNKGRIKETRRNNFLNINKVTKADEGKKFKGGGLYENIHRKQQRIADGSGERMRKVGSKGAPTAESFKKSAKIIKR